MDVIQAIIEPGSSGHHMRCKHCNILLPLSATFCGTCGTRVMLNLGSEGLEIPDDECEMQADIVDAQVSSSRPATQPPATLQSEASSEVTLLALAEGQKEIEEASQPVALPVIPTTPEPMSEEIESAGQSAQKAERSIAQRVSRALTKKLPVMTQALQTTTSRLSSLQATSQMMSRSIQTVGQKLQSLPMQAVSQKLVVQPARVVSQRLMSLSPQVAAETATTLLKRVQRFILSEQQHATTAVALIETPQRLQPDQHYAIRLRLMGRGEAKKAKGGLSALRQNDVAHIEVRSALFEHYAYVLQHADVLLPGQGYAAEVTIPMPPFMKGQSGRHERLQIFLMDKERHPLYEKPFVIEIFVSRLVRLGREGHQALSIPV